MSPSTRRAWIEIMCAKPERELFGVALHPEGVDRNSEHVAPETGRRIVALHPEGVDRNKIVIVSNHNNLVALHPEGVDRNCGIPRF